MWEKTQQCVGLTQLLPTLYKFRQNERHIRNGENSTVDKRKITASSPGHNKWPRKKLKNWSSDTDIKPNLDQLKVAHLICEPDKSAASALWTWKPTEMAEVIDLSKIVLGLDLEKSLPQNQYPRPELGSWDQDHTLDQLCVTRDQEQDLDNTKYECWRNPRPCLQDHNITRLAIGLYRKICRWSRIKTEETLTRLKIEWRRSKCGKITQISYLKKWNDQIAGFDIIDSGAVTLGVVQESGYPQKLGLECPTPQTLVSLVTCNWRSSYVNLFNTAVTTVRGPFYLRMHRNCLAAGLTALPHTLSWLQVAGGGPREKKENSEDSTKESGKERGI